MLPRNAERIECAGAAPKSWAVATSPPREIVSVKSEAIRVLPSPYVTLVLERRLAEVLELAGMYMFWSEIWVSRVVRRDWTQRRVEPVSRSM